jgi:translocation and assembly module TamA
LPEARGYVSVGEDDRFTFAARLRIGSLVTASGRPEESAVVTRFYAGGSLSMRGFGVRRLAPMVLVPLPTYDDAHQDRQIALPIGGNGLIEGSFEARARVSENVLFASFVDFGTVTRDRVPLSEIGRMSWAVGFGFRFLTPIGPLRIDLAVRLPGGRPPPLFDLDGNEITYEKPPDNQVVRGTETGEHVDRNCFGIGGREDTWVHDGLCAFHLSIGEAF